MLRFGLKPKVALLSHSNFGSSNLPSAVKMRQTLDLLHEQAPWLEVDGEMHGDIASTAPPAADDAASTLAATPTCWCCPTSMQPIFLQPAQDGGGRQHRHRPGAAGAAKPVHILTASTTARRIVNMTALTVADANAAR